MKKINEIEQRRIANILIYFANFTENLGVTKANKLLYYLDCNHLLKYGRTVIKDKYVKNPFGPVPIETYNKLTILRELSCFPEKDRLEFNSGHELLAEYISVKTEQLSSECNLDRIIPMKEFEPKWFSKSELSVMEELAKEHCYTTASELVRKTHNESPYNEADENDNIDLKLFLKDNNVPQNEIDRISRNESIIKAIAAHYQ